MSGDINGNIPHISFKHDTCAKGERETANVSGWNGMMAWHRSRTCEHNDASS